MHATTTLTTAPSRRHTLADLLRRSAARHPHKLALACGEVRWTYREFDALCDRLAAGLAGVGIARGDRVAILARNSHAFAALRFALARLGAVLVPVNFMLQADEAAYILRHAGVRLLATDTGLAALALAACTEALPPVALTGSDLAQIVYTSGTEALPKGAMLTHDALLWQYVSCVVDASIAGDDLPLHALPLYHCAQLDVFLGPAVYVGASNVITGKPQPEHLLALIERHRIGSFFAPPTVWIALLRSPAFDRSDLSSLTKGYYGASIMPVEVMKEILRRLPALRLWNLYGQTEIAPLATMLGPDDQLRKPGSCGRPVLNVETRVVDEQLRDVGPGEVVKAGQTLTEAEVLAHCRAQLAGFKVPKRVLFAPALPKNPSGKLLKRELRAAHGGLFEAP